MTKRWVVAASLLALILVVFATSVAAQTSAPREGRLLITVFDPLGGVVPTATVTVTGQDAATKARTLAPIKTSDKGLATFAGLVPGKYTIQAEFAGFEIGILKDVSIKIGDNKHVVVLPLKKLEESVTVARDRQQAAADRGVTFGSAMTREQIEALSDDPDEMARQLKQIAGPDAVIRVDSFEGAQLPPKSQIKSIHITRDTFAAEAHAAGHGFIDIITQPGIGALRAGTRMGYSNSALDGQNPLVSTKGPAQNQSYGGNLGGTLIKDKSNFSINFQGGTSYSTPALFVATPTGLRSEYLDLRVPRESYSISGLLDYAITKDQTLRFAVTRNHSNAENQGAGGFNQIERTYSSLTDGMGFRVQEAGPIGRRFFTNTRFAVSWTDQASRSVIEAPTYVVTDAFTSGGAQQKGGTHPRTFNLASDLDYVRGIHSWRTGIQLDGGRYRTDLSSNYLGTYTFESLDAFIAGTPRSYTRRTGDPNIEYWNILFGYYFQDDIRVRKNLTISAGIRVEAQTHLRDYNNIAPRVGFTWAPFKSGKTSVRASAGIFYDWLAAGTYEQTLRVDGFRQQEINILSPSFPDPGAVGAATPTNRYLLGDNLTMTRSSRFSSSVSQTVNSRVNIGASYSYTRTNGLLVGENLNTPVLGLRPDPTFANVIRTVSDAQSRAHALSVNGSLYFFPTPGGSAASQPRFNWKRGLSIYAYYYVARSENNTDGAFAVPATGSLAAEWGPAPFDTRHRLSLSLGTGALKNFNASIDISVSTGSAITVRTGLDDNQDGIFNDRPAGVGRNSERVPGQWYSSAYFGYSLGLGKKTVAMPPGIMIMNGPGGMVVSASSMPAPPRYRLGFNVSIQNLTNHATYSGYSGVMTSPFFLKPTGASGVRQANFSMNLSF